MAIFVIIKVWNINNKIKMPEDNLSKTEDEISETEASASESQTVVVEAMPEKVEPAQKEVSPVLETESSLTDDSEPAPETAPEEAVVLPVAEIETHETDSSPDASSPDPSSSAEATADKPSSAEATADKSSSAEATADSQTDSAMKPEAGIPFIQKVWLYLGELRKKANSKRTAKQEKNLEIILAEAWKTETITNNDVERVTGVSDRQALNYLKELVKRGKLMRFGKGRNIHYKPLR
jgi:hypothetical protein